MQGNNFAFHFHFGAFRKSMAIGPDRASFLVDQICARCGAWRDLFALVGITVVTGVSLKLVWNLGRTLWVHYGGTAKQQEIRLLKCGQWASKFYHLTATIFT